ncbi:GTPase [Selenomonas ruminantium]|uniref:GTPase n=1 Tax=Selenomonas ruminantium TaxID=971 RepID=UPI0026F0E5EF|nr:GTPase [Selenomonas ruminantium]
MPRDISSALLKCQEYAKTGHELADIGCSAIMKFLEKECKRLADTKKSQEKLKRGEWSIVDAALLSKQERKLKENGRKTKQLQHDLKRLYESQKEFTVLVFGRTMVGKSTLMEILTHGEGKSIGNGTQRTTRDVRDYHWNGLKVIDVPGIASFDGKEDDNLAFAAAKSADLIMFLISDDGVQAEEAKHLARLLSIGKPVLGVINIKVGVTDKPRPVDMKRIAKKMGENERIGEICNQFRAYASEYEQNWNDLTFVHTHLKAAYIGQDKNEELWNLSNFEAVEDYLLEKVEKDGAFLRIKTFADTVAKPMQARLEDIVASSSENLMIGLEFREKYNDLNRWKDKFIEKTKDKHKAFMENLDKKIKNIIYDFVERNYENEKAGKDWIEYLNREIDIKMECEKFFQDINKYFRRKQRELMDDMQSDLYYAGVDISTENIKGEKVTDVKFIAHIVLEIAGFLSPLGKIGKIIGHLLIELLESKEERIRKQKKDLREKIEEEMNKVILEIGDKIWKVLNDNILEKGVNGLLITLAERDEIMMKLANEESSIAYEMMKELTFLNEYLWQEAEEYLGLSVNDIYNIARVPGTCLYVFGQNKYKKDDLVALSKLLMGMGKLTYRQLSKEEKDKPYFIEIARELFMNNIEVNSINYGEDGKVYVYEVPNVDKDELRKKWEYSVIQQIKPLPVK